MRALLGLEDEATLLVEVDPSDAFALDVGEHDLALKDVVIGLRVVLRRARVGHAHQVGQFRKKELRVALLGGFGSEPLRLERFDRRHRHGRDHTAGCSARSGFSRLRSRTASAGLVAIRFLRASAPPGAPRPGTVSVAAIDSVVLIIATDPIAAYASISPLFD
jgi:hypothetical protein